MRLWFGVKYLFVICGWKETTYVIKMFKFFIDILPFFDIILVRNKILCFLLRKNGVNAMIIMYLPFVPIIFSLTQMMSKIIKDFLKQYS